MGLETTTYIDGLDATNPVHTTDNVSQGDDHIRLIKSSLLATFPNVAGAMTSNHTELNYLDGTTGTTGTLNVVLSESPTITGSPICNNTLNVSGVLTAGSFSGSIAATEIDSATFADARVAASNVTQHQAALSITKSQVSDFGTPLYSGDTATTLNIGDPDTTLSRNASGYLAVEGAAVASHIDAALPSCKIFFSNTTEPTTEGNNGDIFLVY